MPTVDVTFSALPTHVRTARLVAAAVARRAGVDEAILDEVRLAVGEACARAVGLHQEHAPSEAVEVRLEDEPEWFVVTVVDRGPVAPEAVEPEVDALERINQLDTERLAEPAPEGAGRDPLPDLLPAGFELAVIAGLVDDLQVDPAESGATVVRMMWKRSGYMPEGKDVPPV